MRRLLRTLLPLLALCFAPATLAAAMPELTMFQGETRVLAEPNAGRLAVGNGKMLSAAVLDDREILLIANDVGVSSLHIWTANGRNRDASESLDYERTGTPGIVAAGIGYGYRAPGPLRFAIVLGRQLMFGKMNDSKLTATSEFSPTDRAELKADLGRASKEIAELNVTYLQVTLGLLF